jgi:hypothetical protein
MGIFNDYRNTNRDSWRFTYTGQELLAHALKKYDFFTSQETEARNSMAGMLKDPSVRASDPKIDELKKNIEFWGCEREKCIVWVHEFKRSPQKEYSLTLGDVSYFDIAVAPR